MSTVSSSYPYGRDRQPADAILVRNEASLALASEVLTIVLIGCLVAPMVGLRVWSWSLYTDWTTWLLIVIIGGLRLLTSSSKYWWTFQSLGDIGTAIVAGLKDSLALHATAPIFMRSNVHSVLIRRRFLQTFVLNVLVFVGCIALGRAVLAPVMSFILTPSSSTTADEAETLKSAAGYLTSALDLLYHVLLVYPIYGISFVLSRIWYQDIADHAYALVQTPERDDKSKKKAATISAKDIIMMIAEEPYRIVLTLSYFIQMTLLSSLPVIGLPLGTLHVSWLYALYCFEYKWSLQHWNLDRRLDFFEQRWAYFAGFGLPAAAFSYFFPSFIDQGIFAFLFPLFVVLATVAHPISGTQLSARVAGEPLKYQEERMIEIERALPRLPVFRYSRVLNSCLLLCCQRIVRRRIGGTKKPSQPSPSNESKTTSSMVSTGASTGVLPEPESTSPSNATDTHDGLLPEPERHERLSVLSFRLWDDRVFSVHDILSSTTIGELKVRCQPGSDLLANEQVLSFNHRTLQDQHTLSSYGIRDGAIITLLPTTTPPHVQRAPLQQPSPQQQPQTTGRGHHITIYIKTVSRTLTLSVYTGDTLQSLKSKIEELERMPSNDQRLMYAGRTLDDHRTLADYQVVHQSTLHLTRR